MFPFSLLLSPHQYVKARGSLAHLADFTSAFGKNAFLLFDPFILDRDGDMICRSLEKRGVSFRIGALKRECSVEEGKDYLKMLQSSPPDYLVGIGGGKAIDLAKWIAGKLDKPFIAVPTSTATCAAATAISVMYSPEGRYRETVSSTPAALTLVDPEILLTQPPRLLAAGMADAMAKWIESRGMRKEHHKRILPASALSLSRVVYEFLVRRGTRGLEDLKKGNWTQTLSELTDITIFVTGIISALGGESVRVSAAHAFQDAYCGLGNRKDTLHGEWVAFGMIFQMVLEGASLELIKRHVVLFKRWEMPLALEDLGVERSTPVFEAGIAAMMRKDSPLRHLMIPVQARQVREAILKADEIAHG